MADISALYPQPYQNPWANPQSAIQMGQGINALQQFGARQAVGQAYQNALNPDGSMDQEKLAAGLKNPAAAVAAPEAIGTMLDLRGKSISNDRSAFELGAGQNAYVANRISALANKPGLSSEDVNSAVLDLARGTNIPTEVLNGWRAGMPKSGPALKSYLTGLATSIQGAGASFDRVGAVDANGQPVAVPRGAANYNGAIPTALPPGQGEALAANQGQFVKDQQDSSGIMSGVRPLQNALPLIAKLGNTAFGPGAEGFSQVKAALQTAGVIPAGASDTEVRQEVNKYLKQYAGVARGADRSDQGLHQALGSNPNLDLTQGANLALVKNQIAMDRMSAAIPVAFQSAHPSAQDKTQYLDYKSKFYQNMDPRAFQFDLMSPQDRRAVIDGLGDKNSPAFQKFARSYQIAKSAGMLAQQQ